MSQVISGMLMVVIFHSFPFSDKITSQHGKIAAEMNSRNLILSL